MVSTPSRTYLRGQASCMPGDGTQVADTRVSKNQRNGPTYAAVTSSPIATAAIGGNMAVIVQLAILPTSNAFLASVSFSMLASSVLSSFSVDVSDSLASRTWVCLFVCVVFFFFWLERDSAVFVFC